MNEFFFLIFFIFLFIPESKNPLRLLLKIKKKYKTDFLFNK